MADLPLSSFVATLRQTGILDDRQVHELENSVTAANPRTLADELVRRQWLTPFQAEQLEKGNGDGLVLGQYVLLDRIGEGGMGQVFKARHRLMQRIVALKVIKKDQLDSPQAIQRFHREIRAVAQLAHPNVVLAHDADQVGDTHYFVMEHVEGIDLGKRVKKHGPLPVGLACDVIRQAAIGLQHAHERGLVHRDIKPSNLLLANDGVVKVLDLGLARLRQSEGDLTETGAVMGTPDFMAPEQAADSRTVDIRGDLYSLGCTLFYLLTGRPVFPADSFTAKLCRHMQDEPDAVESLRPEVPAAVGAIVRTLLAKKPADRYQTPAELATALTPYCAGGAEPANRFDTVTPVAGKPASPAEKKANWQGDSKTAADQPARSRSLMATIAIALLLGLAGLTYFLVNPGNAPTPAPVVEVAEAPPPAKVETPKADPPPPEAAEPVIHHDEPAPPVVAKPAGPERIALLIGVGRYETGDLAGLPYADADMQQFDAALQVAGYPPEGIRTLGGQTARALDIRRELHRLKQLTPRDSLIVAFAGQVVQFDGAEECYLCPADARLDDRPSLIPFTELHAALQACPAGFKLLIIDACRAQAAVEGAVSGSQRPVPPQHIKRPAPPEGVAVLWSCADGEIAHDYPERKQSMLGCCLAEALRGNSTQVESHVQGRVFAAAFQQRRRGQTPERLGVTGGPAPLPGLDSFTAPVPTGELAILNGHADGVTAVAFAPDGLSALSASTDSSVRLWDLAGRREKRSLDPDVVSVPWAVAFAADGKLAVIGTGGVKEAGRLKPGSPFHNTVRIWDAVAGREMKELQGHGDYVSAVALSPDSKLAASGSHDRSVRLWSVASGKEIAAATGHAGRVTAVAFSPDGQQIASASDDGTVRLWSLTGKPVWRFTEHAGPVRSIAFAPDGLSIASAGDDGTIHIIERKSGQELRCLNGHDGAVMCIAFAPTGQRLLSGGHDKTLRLWDATTGNVIGILKGHIETVTGVAFSPEGRRALSGSLDRTVRLWALP